MQSHIWERDILAGCSTGERKAGSPGLLRDLLIVTQLGAATPNLGCRLLTSRPTPAPELQQQGLPESRGMPETREDSAGEAALGMFCPPNRSLDWAETDVLPSPCSSGRGQVFHWQLVSWPLKQNLRKGKAVLGWVWANAEF